MNASRTDDRCQESRINMDGWQNDVLVLMGLLITVGMLWEMVGRRGSSGEGRALVFLGIAMGLLITARRQHLIPLEVLAWMLVLTCLPLPARGYGRVSTAISMGSTNTKDHA